MKILLDTHVFLWYISGDDRLDIALRRRIQNPRYEVYFSVVSLWEATIKYQLGKLPLPQSPDIYLPGQRQKHSTSRIVILNGFTQSLSHWRKISEESRFSPIREVLKHLIANLELDEASVKQLVKLPLLHRDPFDRLLICQAIQYGLSIATVDSHILKYPVGTP